MSRSRRKTPITGITTSESEKQDKQFANRKDRRVNGSILRATHDDTKIKIKREISNLWAMDKDGKYPFDPKESPELMRK